MAITHNPPPNSNESVKVGRRFSDETRRKISEALAGKPKSEAHRRKILEVNRDPELLKRKAATKKARRKPPETHRAVHKRLVSDRGSARDYQCSICSSPANAWAHGWDTWEDVAQDIGGKRLTFSTNLDVYQALCHRCHNRLDRKGRPWDPEGSRTGAKLTESDVRWIRTCGLSLDDMAELLGVDKTTVCSIRIGKSWADIA